MTVTQVTSSGVAQTKPLDLSCGSTSRTREISLPSGGYNCHIKVRVHEPGSACPATAVHDATCNVFVFTVCARGKTDIVTTTWAQWLIWRGYPQSSRISPHRVWPSFAAHGQLRRSHLGELASSFPGCKVGKYKMGSAPPNTSGRVSCGRNSVRVTNGTSLRREQTSDKSVPHKPAAPARSRLGDASPAYVETRVRPRGNVKCALRCPSLH